MSDKKAFEDWVESKFVNHDSAMVVLESRAIWDGACAYKDKRIAELEAHITDLQETVSALMDHIGPYGMKPRGRRG